MDRVLDNGDWALGTENSALLFRQRNAACGGIWQIEEGGVSHGADACASAGLGDHDAKSCLLVAIRPEEAQFHQFTGAQMPLQLDEERRGESAFADFKGRFQLLAESAQEAFLCAGEGKFIHGKINLAQKSHRAKR